MFCFQAGEDRFLNSLWVSSNGLKRVLHFQAGEDRFLNSLWVSNISNGLKCVLFSGWRGSVPELSVGQ